MKRQKPNFRSAFAVLVTVFFVAQIVSCQKTYKQQNWTQFRGSNLDGISKAENIPTTWDEEKNGKWKTKIHDLGVSAPVVFDNQIWVTTGTSDGKELYAVCVDYENGEIVHDIKVFEPAEPQSIHSMNTYATSTACIEKGFVYVHFGTHGTACIRTETGETVWKRDDMNCNHVQGAASSPIIYNDFLILHLEGSDVQDIYALNKTTGETVWKTSRPAAIYDTIKPIFRKAYITPIVIEVEGQKQLISNGAQLCVAYNPDNGEEIWRVWYGHDSSIAMPLYYNGIVFINTGWIFPEGGGQYAKMLAVDPKGKGDITHTNVQWELDENVAQISTPVLVNGLIYMIEERGNLSCVEAATGKIVWHEKLKGQFTASPIYADGKIYIMSRKGTGYVINEGKELKILAENELEGEIKATPAILRNSIIVRSKSHLYRICEK